MVRPQSPARRGVALQAWGAAADRVAWGWPDYFPSPYSRSYRFRPAASRRAKKSGTKSVRHRSAIPLLLMGRLSQRSARSTRRAGFLTSFPIRTTAISNFRLALAGRGVWGLLEIITSRSTTRSLVAPISFPTGSFDSPPFSQALVVVEADAVEHPEATRRPVTTEGGIVRFALSRDAHGWLAVRGIRLSARNPIARRVQSTVTGKRRVRHFRARFQVQGEKRPAPHSASSLVSRPPPERRARKPA